MMTTKTMRLLLVRASLSVLASCSMLERGRVAKEQATAEEKAGRIAMVLGDDALVADPALATTPTKPKPNRLKKEIFFLFKVCLCLWPRSRVRFSRPGRFICGGQRY